MIKMLVGIALLLALTSWPQKPPMKLSFRVTGIHSTVTRDTIDAIEAHIRRTMADYNVPVRSMDYSAPTLTVVLSSADRRDFYQRLISNIGLVEFHLQSQEGLVRLQAYLRSSGKDFSLSAASKLLPLGTSTVNYCEVGPDGALVLKGRTVVEDSEFVPGSTIQEVQTGGSAGNYRVYLRLDASGASKMKEMTSHNVGKSISIVFNGQSVYGAKISEPISSDVQLSDIQNKAQAIFLKYILLNGSVPVSIEPQKQ